MKRCVCIICVIVFAFCLVSCNNYSEDEQADYFYKINQLISDVDFNTAKVKDSKIILYNRENDIINEIEFEEYEANIRLLHIRKEGAKIYFVTSASIDDDAGIVFINDGSDSIMDGVYALERVGHGASYKYRTYP